MLYVTTQRVDYDGTERVLPLTAGRVHPSGATEVGFFARSAVLAPVFQADLHRYLDKAHATENLFVSKAMTP